MLDQAGPTAPLARDHTRQGAATVVVWDLPLRLFHWLLAAAVAALVISGELGGLLIDRHGQLGMFVLALLVFRLVWGVVGSTYARFSSFLPTPSRLRAYLKGEWHGLGHNPLGALSVFALLGVLGLQVATGLVANDDIAFHGPLYPYVGKELSDTFTKLHHLLGSLLIALVALHLAAIAFYRLRGKDLVRPMLTGRVAATAPDRPLRGGSWRALLLALLLAFAAVFAVKSLAGAAGRTAPPAAAAPAQGW